MWTNQTLWLTESWQLLSLWWKKINVWSFKSQQIAYRDDVVWHPGPVEVIHHHLQSPETCSFQSGAKVGLDPVPHTYISPATCVPFPVLEKYKRSTTVLLRTMWFFIRWRDFIEANNHFSNSFYTHHVPCLRLILRGEAPDGYSFCFVSLHKSKHKISITKEEGMKGKICTIFL